MSYVFERTNHTGRIFLDLVKQIFWYSYVFFISNRYQFVYFIHHVLPLFFVIVRSLNPIDHDVLNLDPA